MNSMGLKGRSLTMMNKLKHFLILLLLCFVLISCQSNDHVIETIYDHLTATVLIEENFEKYQEKINELASEEQEIYNELIGLGDEDRKSTRLNSSHVANSNAVICLKKKKNVAN